MPYSIGDPPLSTTIVHHHNNNGMHACVQVYCIFLKPGPYWYLIRPVISITITFNQDQVLIYKGKVVSDIYVNEPVEVSK